MLSKSVRLYIICKYTGFLLLVMKIKLEIIYTTYQVPWLRRRGDVPDGIWRPFRTLAPPIITAEKERTQECEVTKVWKKNSITFRPCVIYMFFSPLYYIQPYLYSISYKHYIYTALGSDYISIGTKTAILCVKSRRSLFLFQRDLIAAKKSIIFWRNKYYGKILENVISSVLDHWNQTIL